jgi:hypothetical protein
MFAGRSVEAIRNDRLLRIPLKKSESWRGFSCAAGMEAQ